MTTSFPLLVLFACGGGEDPPKPDDGDSPPAQTDDTGETQDTDTAGPDDNHPPEGLAVAITPATPPAGADFAVVIVTPATDPDGDAVSYRYAWTVDGAAANVEGDTVAGADTVDNQVWEVAVTPTDGTDDGIAATAVVVIGNSPPSAVGVTISPAEPADGEALTITIDPVPVDPDGDALTTTITWYQNEAEVPWWSGYTEIDGGSVEDGETFRVVVAVTDGFNPPVTAEDTVEVAYSCTRPAPFSLEDNTLSDATAYHGIGFDDDGTLIGWDGRGSLMKSTYGVGDALFVPGVSGVEQIDRLPDGDFVYADSTNQRLVRLTSAGSTSTLASGLGGSSTVYGATVGPDGKVWVANGGVLRVDPDTGESETILSDRSLTVHSLNFNLDSTRLFLGTIGSGDLYYLDLDADLNPTGSPAVYASGLGGWHDGVEVDECGNVYVADYTTRGLYRVEEDGTVTLMVRADPTSYGHGVAWGEGVGGWRTDTLYQPQPYNGSTVREVVLGVGSGDGVRTWNGVPVSY
ncbi:MAG: hypothetical protein ACOZNI_04360 [Myxococcota bacterium]